MKSLSTSSLTLKTFTQQDTVTHCLLFTYLRTQSSQPITSRINQRLLYLLINQIAHHAGFLNFQLTDCHLTLKMASAQVVETSVAKNSPSQDSNHPDDLFRSRYVVTVGLKPFSYHQSFLLFFFLLNRCLCCQCCHRFTLKHWTL